MNKHHQTQAEDLSFMQIMQGLEMYKSLNKKYPAIPEEQITIHSFFQPFLFVTDFFLT